MKTSLLKKIVLLVLILGTLKALTTTLKAQGPTIAWQKCLGGSNEDYVNSVKSTSDGGYVVIGTTFSSDGDVASNGYGVWIVKLDANKNILWQKTITYPGINLYGGYDVVEDNANNILALTNVLNGPIGTDGYTYIYKLDPLAGITLDSVAFSFNNFNSGSIYSVKRIIATNDGGFAMVGDSLAGVGNGMRVHKCDSNMNLQWYNIYGGALADNGFDIKQASDGGFLIGGSRGESQGFDIIKTDALGNVQWSKNFGSSSSDSSLFVTYDNAGNILIAGTTNGNDLDVSGNHGQSDIWVAKLDMSGTLIWSKCLGGTGYENAADITVDANNDVYILGSTNSNDGHVNGLHGTAGYSDLWLVKLYGTNGSIEWQKCLGGSMQEPLNNHLGNSRITNVTTIGTGSIVTNTFAVCGTTMSNDGDVSGYHGAFDYWVVKLSTNGTTGLKTINSNNGLTIYPNPSNGIFTIKSLDAVQNVTVTNILGELVYAANTNNMNAVTIDMSQQPKGLYVVNATIGNSLFVQKVVVE